MNDKNDASSGHVGVMVVVDLHRKAKHARELVDPQETTHHVGVVVKEELCQNATHTRMTVYDASCGCLGRSGRSAKG